MKHNFCPDCSASAGHHYANCPSTPALLRGQAVPASAQPDPWEGHTGALVDLAKTVCEASGFIAFNTTQDLLRALVLRVEDVAIEADKAWVKADQGFMLLSERLDNLENAMGNLEQSVEEQAHEGQWQPLEISMESAIDDLNTHTGDMSDVVKQQSDDLREAYDKILQLEKDHTRMLETQRAHNEARDKALAAAREENTALAGQVDHLTEHCEHLSAQAKQARKEATDTDKKFIEATQELSSTRVELGAMGRSVASLRHQLSLITIDKEDD